MLDARVSLALFDELEKIAEERDPMDKSKLRNLLLTVVPATALGTGLGYATGRLIRRHAGPAIRRNVPESVIRKYGPAVASGLATGAAAAAYYHRKSVGEAMEKKHEKRRAI
jgi:hypothetical protein